MVRDIVPAPAELCFGDTDGSVSTSPVAISMFPAPEPMLDLSNNQLASFALIPVPVLRLAAI